MQENKAIKWTFIALAGLVWCYVAIRAFTLSITHDEVLTWLCIEGDELWYWSPNNHWLNTLLASIPDWFYHHHTPPFWLRLPNVLAFGVYSWFWYRIVKAQHAFHPLLLLALPFIFANPIVLDFFSLCRGYGLAMASLVAALFCTLQYMHAPKARWLLWSLVAQVLMVYANYAFIVNALVLHLLMVPALWAMKKEWKKVLPAFSIDLLYLPALMQISHFKNTNQLYAGGNRDVVHDSIRSLVQQVFFEEKFANQNWLLVYLLGIAFLFLLVLWKNNSVRFALLGMVLLLLVPTLLFALNGTLYGHGRTVIYWCIWWALSAVMVVSAIRHPPMWRVLVAALPLALLSIFVCIHEKDHFGWRLSREWHYDANTDLAIKAIVKDNPEQAPKSISAYWLYEPALNFYRETQELSWLSPVVRDSLGGHYHYYYCGEQNTQELPTDSIQLVAAFPDSKTLLFKRVQGN
jgi:hypothetical protein